MSGNVMILLACMVVVVALAVGPVSSQSDSSERWFSLGHQCAAQGNTRDYCLKMFNESWDD